MNPRLIVSILLPFLALAAQWLLWPWLKPFVWFLFFPAVFFSARLGGLWGGLASSVLCAGIVWYFFLPPQLNWAIQNPNNLWSVGLFLAMGWLFSDTQERLRRAQRNSETALAETRAAGEKITQLYEKTLELDRLKTQFFANVSHELRTPLTLIMSPLARRLSAADLPEAVRREEEMMLRNARLLYRHVSDLLDAAKLESGRMGMEYSRLDLAGLARAMAAHFESLAQEQNIAYRCEAPTLLEAEVDGEKAQRILLNLLSNAFKFTPAGGRIALSLRTEEGEAVIEVQDNGPGVPVALREAVFGRFRQIAGNASRRHGGTGLGLAIVKEFTELHGGAASVAEAPGGGARFVVRLPLRAPAGVTLQDTSGRLDPVLDRQALDELRPAVPSMPGTAAGDEGRALVLVVEDNPDMNAFIADALRPRYRVASACDGREGLEKALALRPDLVLCDVMMPVMSGDRMVPELRRHPELADLPIVMLTAKADDELRVRLLREGVQDYLDKPFAVDELLARVDGLVATRRRSVEQLRASEARFRRLFQEAPLPLCYVGKDGVLVDINARFVNQFGYRHEDVPTLADWWRLAYPDPAYRAWVLDTWNAAVARAAETGSDIEPIEYRVTCKNGDVRIVLITGITLGDDFLSTFFDVTERRQAEEATLASKAKLEAALASMSDAVFISDTEGRFIEFNDAFATFHKFRNKEECAKTFAEYPDILDVFFPSGELAPVEQWAVPRALRGEIVNNAEYTLRRKDTGETWVGSYSFAPIRDRDGAIVGSVVAGRDITEQKQAEAEIHRLNTDLERRVAERTTELTAANRELDSFAYAVSHDLRAPLRAMSGFAQALREDYGAALQGDARVYLEQIDLASRKMGELIDGLLVLSRSTRGEMRHDAVDLSALAENLLAELARDEPTRQVALEVEAGLAARGDARMLEALLRNLLGNAWKYSSRSNAPRIRVYSEDHDGQRRYCVADNGAGFDMAHANRLFQPFQRLHRQDEFPGIGIGLATVQRIVHRHGGNIEARGEPGKGATFCFSIGQPLAQEDQT